MKAIDLFAGARGWDIAARHLGWDVDGVEKWTPANATATLNGFVTVHEDVRTLRVEPLTYDVLIASPPCQTYSMAGGGEGRRNLDRVLAAVHREHDLSDLDERTGLVLEPLRIALEAKPAFIAWEQVPAVLPVWEACAAVLREHGYSVATGVLNAEQYGVPQTRRRAVLLARVDGTAQLPVPTHSRYHSHDPQRLDTGVKPWVSMAEALVFGARANWCEWERRAVKSMGSGMVERYGSRPGREGDQPAFTIRANAGGTEPGGFKWERPVGKVTAAQAACLQTFPTGYEFSGNKGEVFQQIGNAVPPLLAEAILSTLTA